MIILIFNEKKIIKNKLFVNINFYILYINLKLIYQQTRKNLINCLFSIFINPKD